jgi:HAD superfamily hydrolase (TIGR01509 family)
MSPGEVAPLHFTPRAVVFDMDGLMLDSERAYTAAMAQAARDLGHDLPGSLWLAMVGRGEAVCRQLLGEHVGDAGAQALLDLADERYERLAATGIDHRPGIEPLLRWLSGQGIARAVATSTRNPLATTKLRAAGLLDWFDTVCTSSDVARPKPAPDVYLLAAERLGVEPAQCLVLEDSPTGVRAALAAGMTPIQVPDLLAPDAEVRALQHRIVDSLAQAQALLQARLALA